MYPKEEQPLWIRVYLIADEKEERLIGLVRLGFMAYQPL